MSPRSVGRARAPLTMSSRSSTMRSGCSSTAGRSPDGASRSGRAGGSIGTPGGGGHPVGPTRPRTRRGSRSGWRTEETDVAGDVDVHEELVLGQAADEGGAAAAAAVVAGANAAVLARAAP